MTLGTGRAEDRLRAALVLGIAMLGIAACGGEAPAGTRVVDAAARAVAPDRPHTVVVWATHSLQRPMALLARRYEQATPGARIELWCAGGAEVLQRRNAGTPCDVIAIGDSSAMSRFAAAAHLAPGSPTELARSRIALAVATGNPLGVRGLADIARPGLRLALGKRAASIGRYARWALSNAHVAVEPAVQGDTADDVLAAVQSGAADVGIVYVTSFAERDGIARVDLPEGQNQPVLYSIAVDREAPEPAGAAAFRAFALSPAGQDALRECGFLPIGAK